MKIVVRLSMVVAILLLVTNMAFAKANGCDQERCYKITATDENGNTYNDFWLLVSSCEGNAMLFSEKAGTNYELYPFSGGPGGYSTEIGPPLVEWTTFIAKDLEGGNNTGYIWIPVYGSYIKAIGQRYGTRYTVEG